MSMMRNGILGLTTALTVLGGSPAAWAQDEAEAPLTAEEAAAVAPLVSVVNTLCIPVLQGAKLEDTPGYAALGRPPIQVDEDEPGVSSISTELVDDLRVGPGICSFRGGSQAPGLEAAVVASDRNWVRMPEMQGAYSLYFNAETGLTLQWGRDGLYVQRPEGDPAAVRAHYAAIVAAVSRNRIEALIGAVEACPAYLRRVMAPGEVSAEDDRLLEISTDGTAYGGFPKVRGDIDAQLETSSIGCVIAFEAEPAFIVAFAEALTKPGNGWNADGRGAWRRLTADDQETGTGEALFVDICESRYTLVYTPGEELDYRAGRSDLVWRPCASEALPLPDAQMYRRSGS